jgi:acyl-CoA thioesterase-1
VRPAHYSNRYAGLLRQFNLFVALLGFALCLPPPVGAAEPVRILALGDSLTAGYGLDSADAAYPARLERALKEKGFDVSVRNAGVSGDTSAGGLARLAWALDQRRPDIAIVALGANDGLRGLPPADMLRNLDAIIVALKHAGARVLLAGMLAPPNMGPEYEREFNAVFPALAKKHGVALYPFLLAGVAAEPAMNLPDMLHPNEKGVAVMVDRIAPYVVRLIGELPRK